MAPLTWPGYSYADAYDSEDDTEVRKEILFFVGKQVLRSNW